FDVRLRFRFVGWFTFEFLQLGFEEVGAFDLFAILVTKQVRLFETGGGSGHDFVDEVGGGFDFIAHGLQLPAHQVGGFLNFHGDVVADEGCVLHLAKLFEQRVDLVLFGFGAGGRRRRRRGGGAGGGRFGGVG